MTTPEIEPEPVTAVEQAEQIDGNDEAEKDERKRRLLLLLLLLLLLALCCIGGLIFRYWLTPKPLPDLLLPTQVGGVCYAPTYKYSINNVNGPVAVAVSPDNQRIYAAESKGDRLVKMFDTNGKLITSFAPPGTDKANREAKYMAVAPDGRVFLVDRTSSAIDIYDANGKFIDAIIGEHMTLSKYLASKNSSLPAGTTITHYEGINKVLTYKLAGQAEQTVKVTFPTDEPQWSPLGLRFDVQGNLVYTDVSGDLHSVRVIPAPDLNIFVAGISPDGTATPVPTPSTSVDANAPLVNFNPQIKEFGSKGSANSQFDFPQTAVKDGKGNFYVSDGNNARISVWTPDMKYKTFFGFGTQQGALNLPRGLWMGKRDCLLVADAVGSLIRVYDVSGDEPVFSLEFGGYGISEGTFSYPIDIFVDGTGRLYIADRENNRIQVWSY